MSHLTELLLAPPCFCIDCPSTIFALSGLLTFLTRGARGRGFYFSHKDTKTRRIFYEAFCKFSRLKLLPVQKVFAMQSKTCAKVIVLGERGEIIIKKEE
jgi:hypothetical protein